MEDTPTVPGDIIAGRYTIERELGRGGAAIVFLARDRRQERQVALKVLHRELGQAIGAQRFLREIKHSSALHHPHLLSIHESGESDGRLYYVMPFMRDGSLRTRIAKEKQLAVDESLRITRQVGEALSYAHSQGIVHRDIKPDNVLFSADHACLADFGIARAVDSVAADTLTSTGLVVGTPAYMSPEQASGERKVDARSDQYSLACLLYEMVTGLPPFIGATQQSVISQRFTQPPPSMRAHRPNVPDHVERAVKRALAVVPADRFPTVKEFVAALHNPSSVPEAVSVHRIRRHWFAVGAAAALVTLVVMAAEPGRNWVRGAFGSEPDTTKFVVLPFMSDADPAVGKRVADELHSELRQWEGIAVESDLTVREALKNAGALNSPTDAIELARGLGAGRLIWGSAIADPAGRIRIEADLYDVASSRTIKEVEAAVEEQATGATVRDLTRFLLWSAGTSRPPPYGTRSYAALQAYSRAAEALDKWDLGTAHRELLSAVAADERFGLALLWLARVQSWLEPENSALWGRNAERALAVRDDLSAREQQLAAGLMALASGDFTRACSEFERMRAAQPSDFHGWFGLGECQFRDTLVIRSGAGRSGFRFRSSYHSAGTASARALTLEPRAHVLPRMAQLRKVFATDANQIRAGADSSGRVYMAYPELTAVDTVAYVPFRQEDSENSRLLRPSPDAHFAALTRNKQVLLKLAGGWVREFPKSAEAWSSLASALESRGELDSPRPENGALPALRRARSFPNSDIQRFLVTEAEVRVLLKLGQFNAARSLADSLIAATGAPDSSNWEPLARLAGLTGRSKLLASALAFRWSKDGGRTLDPPLVSAAAALLSHAVLGACSGAMGAERRIDDMTASYVRAPERGGVHDQLSGTALSFLVPCTGGASILHVSSPGERVGRLQVAWAKKDTRAARAILDTLQTIRATYRPGDLSPNLLLREVWVQAQMGDSAGARRQLDLVLNELQTLSASTLSSPIDQATLVQAMVLRADLARDAGDAASARRWGSAVATLWKNADSPLRPTVARMAALSGLGR